jgi:hypothetical protein
MADTAWTADTILVTSGTVVVRKCTETIVEGDWVYEVAAGSTVGVATNADATKDEVIGQAIRGGVTNTHIAVALNGCVCTATATPAVAIGDWFVLSVGGNTSVVADQTTGDLVSQVARGTAAGGYTIDIKNTGVTSA